MNVLDVSQLAQPLTAAHTHILAAGPHEASGVEGTAQYVSIFWVTLAALLFAHYVAANGQAHP